MPPLLCPHCEFTNRFASAQALEAHLTDVHFAYRPYVCDECRGESHFATRQELVDHNEKGHGLTEYKIRFEPNEKELTLLETLSSTHAIEHIRGCVKNAVNGAVIKAGSTPSAASTSASTSAATNPVRMNDKSTKRIRVTCNRCKKRFFSIPLPPGKALRIYNCDACKASR